jgi:acetyl-CoA acyltransferase
MSLRRRTFILGGYVSPFIGKKHPDFVWPKHPDFGKRENPVLEDYITSAVLGALEATGTPAEAVDKAWIGNFVGELFNNQGHLGAAVTAAHPGLMYKPAMRVEGACASGGLAFSSAVEAIQAGSDVTLVVGAEVQTTATARQGGDYLARASHYRRQRAIDDFTFPALFARRAKAAREAGTISQEDLGRVAVKAYSNANKNPLAHMRAVKMTLDVAGSEGENNPAFLANEELAPYMRLSDCSQVSDGGAAAIIVSEDGLRRLGKDISEAVEVLSVGHATGNLYADGDLLELDTTAAAARRALSEAGIGIGDVGVAEVHDCFTVTELLMLEALGIAPRGQAAHMVREGRTELGGDFPVNTGGGLIGFGHPVGATGVKQLLEIWRQLKGKAGDYQIASRPRFGITANMGGDDKTSVVTVIANT